MRKLFLVLSLLFFQSAIAQNDLLGQWYLHYIEIGGQQTYSTVPNSINTIDIISTTVINGTVCNNGFSLNYNIIDANTLSTITPAILGGYCDYSTEFTTFFNPHLSIFSSSTNSSNILTYTILGTGANETLQLTKTNGDYAFYSRSPLENNLLPNIWYINSITENGIEYLNTYNNTFNINFTTTPGFLEGIDFNGAAICNNISGQYNLLSPTTLDLSGYITTNSCNTTEEDDFEMLFSNFLEFNSGYNTFTYEITGTGNNASLKLIKQDGIITRNNPLNEILLSRQALSVTENEVPLGIKVFPNPTADVLYINNSSAMDYSIHAINGKTIKTGHVNVNGNLSMLNLQAGVYFLSLYNDGGQKEIIKFVKK